MGRERNYFYISGFISISLFLLFLGMFIYMMFTTAKIETYGLKKENYISISMVIPKNVAKQYKKAPSATVAPSSDTPSKNIDVNDLFSDVWTQKISEKKVQKEVNSKRIQEIQKRISKTKEREVEKISQKLNSLDTSKTNEEKDSASTANEVNEYLAKIQALVYQYFNVPPNSEGNSVKTVIELDALGRMIDFRVLNYSSNEALNEEVDRIKDRLKNVVFPKNPLNKSSKTIVILISEE